MAFWSKWFKKEVAYLSTGEEYYSTPTPLPSDFYHTNSALRSVIDTISAGVASVPLKFYTSDKTKIFTLSDICEDDYTLVFDITISLLQGEDVYLGLSSGKVEICEKDHKYSNTVTLSANAWRGKMNALSDELHEARNASQYRAQVWQRAGRFGGWFERPAGAPALDDAGVKRLTTALHAFQKDGGRAGETPIFEEGMRYHTATISAKELEWQESQQLLLQHVCNVYNMPVTLLTGSVSEQDRSYFYSDTLAGVARVIQNGFQRLLQNSYIARFNFDAKLMGSFLERAKIMSMLTGAPILDTDEGRAIIDYPAYTGDNLVTPLNVIKGGKKSPQDGDEILPIYEQLKQVEKG